MADSMKQPRDENGSFVSLRDYITSIMSEREKQTERIFAERETSAEFKRLALKEALDEARVTTERALAEAKKSVAEQVDQAKNAADARALVLQTRIEKLESGGAPFASRLDDGIKKLEKDVAQLTTGAVRSEVVEALRKQQIDEAKAQKKQTRAALFAAGLSLIVSIIIAFARLHSGT